MFYEEKKICGIVTEFQEFPYINIKKDDTTNEIM